MAENSVGSLALLVAVGSWVCSIALFLWGRHSEEEAVRRAEKRARLEPVLTYALGLQEFVEAAVAVVRVRQRRGMGTAKDASSEHVQRQLEREWDKVLAVEPRPGALVFIRDREAQECLLRLRLWAQQCRDRCLECLGSGELIADEEAKELVEFAVEKVAEIEGWMREVERKEDR